jgi:hypothetical protein
LIKSSNRVTLLAIPFGVIAQNVAQQTYVTYSYEKGSPKYFATCVIKKTPQSKQLHFGLEFAESGHPVVVLGLTFGDRIVLFK